MKTQPIDCTWCGLRARYTVCHEREGFMHRVTRQQVPCSVVARNVRPQLIQHEQNKASSTREHMSTVVLPQIMVLLCTTEVFGFHGKSVGCGHQKWRERCRGHAESAQCWANAWVHCRNTRESARIQAQRIANVWGAVRMNVRCTRRAVADTWTPAG
jgi:hypothetical protein